MAEPRAEASDQRKKYIPRPPPKAYHAFQREQKEKGNFQDEDGQKFTQWCGKKWKELTAAQKKEYTEQENAEKLRYQDEMRELGVPYPLESKVDCNKKVMQDILGLDKERLPMDSDAEYLLYKSVDYFIGWFHNRAYSAALELSKKTTIGNQEIDVALRSSNELRFLQVLGHDSTPQLKNRGAQRKSDASVVSKTPVKKLKTSPSTPIKAPTTPGSTKGVLSESSMHSKSTTREQLYGDSQSNQEDPSL